MPTIFTHPVVAAGLLPWFGFRSNRPGILLTGAVLTVIPDLDVLSFSLGIPYAHILGHRGLSHSPFVAFIF
ncbi:MAG: metal-dependent hydrolase, partial [Gammaproteobacteria bacterium]|nr:metal-dependent hydrolase [Gammaproteobacteria bacterium]